MRVAVISDIHANLGAFEAVIADWGDVDAVWCLGDVVGYGPDPQACLERLCELTDVCVAGNHDWAAAGRIDRAAFNDLAAEAAAWTAEQLSDEAIEYLAGLPTIAQIGEFTLTHGSPRDPIWEYILSPYEAAENFEYFDGQACFVGHTHVPLGYSLAPAPNEDGWLLQSEPPVYDEVRKLGTCRHLINVGSVGQPRDGDPRACYLILDPDSGRFLRRRVSYNVAATQKRMRRAGLPRQLSARLAVGH
jgi:diadenosine tetraphosphatase ApaH/serine/threonine PP2A family protein phosphatase